jgi:uncharacterized protein (TIGR04222 family)
MWLLFLIPACVFSFLACLRLSQVVAAAEHGDLDALGLAGLLHQDVDLPETAYLAGGPERVLDLTLLNMSVRGGLHLAHTGWTTVVHPVGHSPLERSVIAAIGPEGQCRTAQLRQDVAAGPELRALADGLARTGLATPPSQREEFAGAFAGVVRAACATVVLFGAGLAVSLGLPGDGFGSGMRTAEWFALPLLLTLTTLLMARVDVFPRTRWAAPAGRNLLRASRPALSPLTAVAMLGVKAVRDPLMRAALRG